MSTLTPAYGRDYKSAVDAILDFNEGKDFIFHDIISPYDGKYCSIRDFEKGTKVQIRYAKNRKVTCYNI